MSPLRLMSAGLPALFFVCLGGRVQGQCTAQAGPPTQTVCAGSVLNLNGSGTGQAPLGFAWSGSPYLSSTNTAATTFNYPAPTNGPQSIVLTLTVTDNAGCVATDQVTVTVQATPQPALSTSDTNPDLYVAPGGTSFALCGTGLTDYDFQFTDASTAQAGATYSVDWGPGPAYTPPAGGWSQTQNYGIGLHTIAYTITNPSPGCAVTTMIDVFLGSNPSVGTSNPGNTLVCSGTELVFPINNTAGNSPGTEYVITYGDGNGTTFPHPPPASVTYDYPTTNCPGAPYTFRIDAVTPCPIVSFATAGPIYITDSPVASFTQTADTSCVNAGITFTNTSLGVGGPACSQPLRVWSITPATGWNPPAGMGNTNGSTQPSQWTNGANSINVQFTQAGTYCITLEVGNNLCGTDQVQHCVCIEAPPQPAFTLGPDVGCAPFTSTVDNTSGSPNSCRTTYAWDVQTSGGACGSGPAWNYTGGTSGASFEPQFQFTQAGTYTIELEATNSCGTYPVTEVVTARTPPQVDVLPLAGICAGQCVDPSATVTDCGSPITTYAWSFGGGAPATAGTADPGTICYAAATSSTISLTVTNACGSATDVTTLGVGTLPPLPVVASNSPVCAGQTLSLSASPLPGITYQWSGPNGFNSNQTSVTIPGVTAANAGSYTVVAVSGGCQGPPATVNVQVVPAPTVTVTPPSAAVCNGQSATFTASGAGNYQWFIGSTQVGSGPNFTTSPAVTTTYTVSGSTGGCPGSTTVNITVYNLPNTNAGPDQNFCDQAIPVNMTGSPSPGTWSGPGVTAGGVFTTTPGNLGTVTLTYSHTNSNGCTDTDQVDVIVGPVTVFADAGNDTSFCLGTVPVFLPAQPPGGTWVGAGPGGSFTPSTVGNFNVTYNYGSGTCATSDQVMVHVLPAPILNVLGSFSRCADALPVPLTASPSGGVWTGAGVSGPPYVFDPTAASAGDHTLTYTFTDGSGCDATAQTTATVNALPVVNAGPDVQLCDQPVPVELGGSPTGGTWTADWMNVTAGGTLTPGGPGTDTLTYTVTNADGCTSFDELVVEVVTIDEPAFAGNDTAVCVNSGALQLSALPTGGTWSGPQVSSSGLLDTDLAGTFTLTYSVGSATCLLVDQVTVEVHALPSVDAGDDIAVCQDGGVQILVATPAGGTWSGTGVDPITGAFDPLLALPGGTPVTYTYTDPVTGCTNSDAATVTVNPLPVASFTHDPIACVNVPFPFSNTSTGASDSEWDFGDGGTSILTSLAYMYTEAGTYTVRLISGTGAGCRDTTYSSVTVWDVPQTAVILSVDTGCGPLQVDFTNDSEGEGLDYSWDFGGLGTSVDEDPPPFTFPSDPEEAVTYSITLTATNVCGTADATADVVVMPSPTASFGPDVDTHCSFADVPFGNASYGLPTSFQWDFGDGEVGTDPGPIVTHAYVAGDDPTPFTITLVAANACGSDTAEYTITVVPNEVTAFFNTDPTIGCGPLTVDLTQFSSGDTATYWDLGDGNTSLEYDLSHTFTDPGTYVIRLFAYGCGFDTDSIEVTVLPSPTASFTATPQTVCVGEPIVFASQTPDVVGLEWDFDDGTTSTLTAPEHTYATSGTYTVTLTVTGVLNSCPGTAEMDVVVSPTPTAAFTTDPTNGCIDLDVAFHNTSSNGGFHQWDFGDGNTSALAEPFHTYTTAGTYTVQLIVESLNACRDTTTAEVVAHPLPVSAFTLSSTSSCTSPVAVQTLNASQGAVGYEWDLGQGGVSQLNQPEVVFPGPGTYTVQLVAINQYGCRDTSDASFIVHPTPLAAFTAEPQPGCAGYPVVFTNTSVNANSYQWWLGDGTTTPADAPSHTYPEGTYDVVLVATGAGGCRDTLNVPAAVTINPSPIAAFTTDTLTSVRNAIRFSNESQGAVAWTWDFADGTTSDEVHPLHVFPADGGGFAVCLIAVNTFNCPDTICEYINVGADPLVFAPNAFTPNEDGLNDEFRPILNGYESWNYRLLIFDRWGEVVHENTDRNAGWDGTRNGKDALIDVYVWKVVVERYGDARDFIGHVSLVR